MRLGLTILMAVIPFLVMQAKDVYIGKGCTTAFHIDKDCDGYGIGPDLKGADADDNDAEVSTTATVVTKYGTVDSFIRKVKGYNALRYWIIDPNGNNATCAASADLAAAEAKACHSLRNDGKADGPFEKSKTLGLQPGDVVLWKEGLYTGTGNFYMGSKVGGTAENPIIFMAYPGASARFVNDRDAFSIQSKNYITLDGLDIGHDPKYLGNGIVFNMATGVTMRNNWVHDTGNGMMLQYDIHDLLIEQNVISDSRGSHCIYMGQNADHDGGGRQPAIDPPNPNSNITVRGNVLYRCGAPHIQHNGSVTKLLIEGNIIHSSHRVMNGIALLNGATNSIVRNNLVFNLWGAGLQIYTYDDNSLAIWPRSQHDILVEGNTLVSNCYNGDTESIDSGQCFPQISVTDTSGAQLPMKNFTFRNNKLIGTSRAGHQHFRVSRYAGDGDASHGHACNYGAGWEKCTGLDNGLDPLTSIIPYTTFEGNTLWPTPSDGFDVGTRNTCYRGSGCSDSTPANRNLTWKQFSSIPRANGFSVSGNTKADPQFKNYTPPNSTTSTQDFSIKQVTPAPALVPSVR